MLNLNFIRYCTHWFCLSYLNSLLRSTNTSCLERFAGVSLSPLPHLDSHGFHPVQYLSSNSQNTTFCSTTGLLRPCLRCSHPTVAAVVSEFFLGLSLPCCLAGRNTSVRRSQHAQNARTICSIPDLCSLPI